MDQKKLIHELDWNFLLILDECRYDYFERVFTEYLKGDLQKVRSSGSDTPEWLRKTFGNQYYDDVVYISANPYVNSKGVELIDGFDARNHFYKILDVWDSDWNDTKKTVLPKSVRKVSRTVRGKYPEKKLLVHFMQPHGPYLTLDEPGEGLSYNVARARGREEDKILKKFHKRFKRFAEKILGEKKACEIGNLLGIRQKPKVVQKYDKEKLRKAYEKNLRIVLKEVAKLVEELPGAGVITSDHGVMLGEHGYYGRFGRSEDPLIREVPWLSLSRESTN